MATRRRKVANKQEGLHKHANVNTLHGKLLNQLIHNSLIGKTVTTVYQSLQYSSTLEKAETIWATVSKVRTRLLGLNVDFVKDKRRFSRKQLIFWNEFLLTRGKNRYPAIIPFQSSCIQS